MSRAVFFSILLFSHMFLRIVISSLVGTFEHMLVRSRDVNFMFLSYGMALRSFISWAVFSTLNAYGRGMWVCSFLTSILARLLCWGIPPVYDWSYRCTVFVYFY